MNLNNFFYIDYPNDQLTPQGKFINDVASLVAQRRIYNPFQQPEAVFMPIGEKTSYEGFKAWAELGVFNNSGQKIDRLAYLNYILSNEAQVGNFPGFLKLSKTDYENQIVPSSIRNSNGLTWKQWSEQKGQTFNGERQQFTRLILAENLTHVLIRPSLYQFPTSSELKVFFDLAYVSVTDERTLS